ncbi:MAG: hypothetical protein JXA08_07115 [Methanomicrobiaceae archaeon]|nr:hypothetical protein [Methanomicrobiaceae archaeon]
MEYMDILKGSGEPMSIYADIVRCLENFQAFPFFIEPVYRQSLSLGDDGPDRLRFALVRLQVYADIHRYEDMEQTQKIKYVGQVLEKVIFGGLMLEQQPENGE